MKDFFFKRKMEKAMQLPFLQSMEKIFELRNQDKNNFQKFVTDGSWSKFCQEHKNELESLLDIKFKAVNYGKSKS